MTLVFFQVWLDVLSLEKLENLLVFLFVPLFDVIFSLLSSFLQSSGLRCSRLLMLRWWKDSWSNLFLFPFGNCDQCTFFAENVAVNLYSIIVVAIAFE